METPESRLRQRKFHRRSRNGCRTCKAKHIRCDEKRPLCTHCLRHGGACGYLDTDVTNATTEPGPDPAPRDSATPRRASSSLGDVLPKDPFFGYDVDLPKKSYSLFQFFTAERVYMGDRICRSQNSFIVSRALSHPGFLHSALLLTTVTWIWSTGNAGYFEVPYLYHKLQALQFLNEQLAKPTAEVEDGTVAAIASLAVVENSLGARGAAASHLRGLAKVAEIQRRDRRIKNLGLLQRFILMSTRCGISRRESDGWEFTEEESDEQPMMLLLLRAALRPSPGILTIGQSHSEDVALSESMAKVSLLSNPSDCKDGEAVRPASDDPLPSPVSGTHSVSSPKSMDESRSEFMACFLYISMIFGSGQVDAFVVNWLVEQLLATLCVTEWPMRFGSYNRPLWFWTVMFGICAAEIARAETDFEAHQLNTVREAFYAKAKLVSCLLRIETWEDAKKVLKTVAWEDGFDGEADLGALWEKAVEGDWAEYWDAQTV